MKKEEKTKKTENAAHKSRHQPGTILNLGSCAKKSDLIFEIGKFFQK